MTSVSRSKVARTVEEQFTLDLLQRRFLAFTGAMMDAENPDELALARHLVDGYEADIVSMTKNS